MGSSSSRLPRYSGPFSVGSYDLEVPLPKPLIFGTSKLKGTNGQPAFQLETVLCTLFYPVNSDVSSGKGKGKKYANPYWLERPNSEISAGYLKFAGKHNASKFYSIVLATFVFLFGRSITIPCLSAAPIASGTSAAQASDASSKNEDIEKYKVIIFSHGLAGTRRTYSQYCGEMASRGFVVVALESRDGTAPSTSIYNRAGHRKKRLDWIAHDNLEWSDGKERKSLQVRAEQLKLRVREVSAVLEALDAISSGKEVENFRASLQPDFDWRSWRNRLDLQDVVMAGHSFGSATTINVLKEHGLKERFSSGICLDPWIDPLGAGLIEPDPEEQLNGSADSELMSRGSPGQVTVPLLVQNSEAFTLWDEHFQRVKKLIASVKTRSGQANYFMTICGTVHTSFSDFPLLTPPFLLRVQRAHKLRRSGIRTAHPKDDMDTIVRASLEFLGAQRQTNEVNILEKQVEEVETIKTGKGKKMLRGKAGEVKLHYRG